jgi:hypothetical protein
VLRSTFSVMKVLVKEYGKRTGKRHTFLAVTDHDDGMSVTNDVENVLRTLCDAEELRPGMRVIYRDTEGVWDEIVIDARCEFVGFRSLGSEHDRGAALLKAISMRHYQ